MSLQEKPLIPLHIFQTWKTKMMTANMVDNVVKLKKMNPQFKHFLFDDKDCRGFIRRYFKPDVLHAYDHLIPGAYKADLWRYCVLYIHGGIYLDIKYKCVNGFRLIALTEKEHFPCDVPFDEIYTGFKGCWNGLLVSLPRNEILFQAIRNIVDNVKHCFLGKSPLEPTGPILLGAFFSKEEKDKAEVKRYMGKDYNGASFHGIPILTEYKEYRAEQSMNPPTKPNDFSMMVKSINTPHYTELWARRAVYLK